MPIPPSTPAGRKHDFIEESGKVVAHFFAGRRGTVSTASRVAVVRSPGRVDGILIGAAFVVELDAATALLDVLMVAPQWQRRGIATALFVGLISALACTPCVRLVSSWHLAAEPSATWHRKHGFVEEPDYFNAKLYLSAVRQELWRLYRLAQLTPARRAELQCEEEKWLREVGRLEALLDVGDKTGAVACHRFAR